MSTMKIRADRVATGHEVLENVVITVADGFLAEIVSDVSAAGDHGGRDGDRGGDRDDPGGSIDHDHHGWVLPGFVDTHVHGGGGADYGNPDLDEVRRAIDFHSRQGTTTTFASLVTADVDQLVDRVRGLAGLVRSGELAGLHLEGPFLSPERRGAHEPALLRAPEPEVIDSLLAAGEGAVSMVTVAPELPGGLAAIRQLVAAGVTAAIGHTDGDARVVAEALDAGASVATHLFNAMRPIHHREPGPVPRLLTDPRCQVELICDGVHLHPDVINMAVAAAGADRVSLITDAMIATGMSDGDYRLGGLQVVVTDGVARLKTEDGTPGNIAGSTLTMAGAVAFAHRQAGIALPEVAKMASTTPAHWHQLPDVGVIAPGRRADLVFLDDDGGVVDVLRHGSWLDLGVSSRSGGAA